MKRPKKYGQWTTHKLARLRECYAEMSCDDLAKEFSPHPIKSIQTTAYKMGLRRPPRQRDWKTICAQHKPMIFRSPWMTT